MKENLNIGSFSNIHHHHHRRWSMCGCFVLAVDMEDGEITGEREELICVGASLDILSEGDCGIEDPEALLEELCKLSPDAFCEEDD